ncbi:MAG: lipooligosaccharide transport system, ABC transporter permease component LptF, partial [Candidatus Campylobacter infans]
MISRVNQYFFYSFLNSFISLFATLFLVVSIVFFIQIARITSYIEISLGELFRLYSYLLPQILLFTAPIAFFIGVAVSF